MVVLAEIPASRGELALVCRALLARAPAPGGVNFQERVLDVVALFSHVSSVADRMAPVRVALVSPYSYTYPGGVGRHVEALAQELTGLGHEVRLLAPYDPDDRLARVLHRGASPQPRPLPDYVIPLGGPSDCRSTARCRTCRVRSARRSACSGASCAAATTTWCTCTSRTPRWCPGTPPRRRAPRWWAPSIRIRRARW